MDTTRLDPLAEILIPAFLDVPTYSRRFRDEHGQPPTAAAKVHHMRSVAQAMVNASDRLMLAEPYTEFGRVEVEDTELDRTYLIRSDSAVTIERRLRQDAALFDSAKYLDTEIVLLVFKFHAGGLDLSEAGTRRKAGRYRLEPTGVPSYVGTWPYSLGGPSPFDQGSTDAFDDLGDIGDGFGDGWG